MLAIKMNIELAVQYAQQWKEYEGVMQVVTDDSRLSIIVLTSCNPAAITASRSPFTK